MDIEMTPLPGVFLITPRRFGDHRGVFSETYNRERYAEAGISVEFVQDNQSMSSKAGTLRGLHYQTPPHGQAKLVRCGHGRIFDVAVDLRTGSPTFGSWVGYELSAENGRQLFIPEGLAHGFMTLEDESEIQYKCSDFYAPEAEGVLRWNDPDIAISWPTVDAPILNDRDAGAPGLASLDTPFSWQGE